MLRKSEEVKLLLSCIVTMVENSFHFGASVGTSVGTSVVFDLVHFRSVNSIGISIKYHIL